MAERRQDEQRQSTAMQTSSGNPMLDFRHQMDRLFDDFTNAFRGMPFSPFGRPAGEIGAFAGGRELADVRFDVSEGDDGIEVTAEMPGMREEDVDIELANNILTVKGEKKAEEEKKEKNYYLSERRYGAFQRSFRLPDGVDEEKISAQFRDGILKIMLPRKPEAQTQQRKIEIKRG